MNEQQAHQAKAETNALTLATTPAANLAYWHEAYGELGMEYPVSADALAIVRNGKRVRLASHNASIINHRITRIK